MMARPAIRRLVLMAGQAAWRLASRHYLSLISAGVLVALAFIVLTSDSFDSRKVGSSDQAATFDGDAAVVVAEERPRRLSVLFYVVNDEVQRDEIAAALYADRFAFDAGAEPSDYVVYLIAGTREEEIRTIARLNFEEIAARQAGVDMRVIDLRGRFD